MEAMAWQWRPRLRDTRSPKYSWISQEIRRELGPFSVWCQLREWDSTTSTTPRTRSTCSTDSSHTHPNGGPTVGPPFVSASVFLEFEKLSCLCSKLSLRAIRIKLMGRCPRALRHICGKR